eukprot:6202860-Pleurochrysis_carterae.AAC.1
MYTPFPRTGAEDASTITLSSRVTLLLLVCFASLTFYFANTISIGPNQTTITLSSPVTLLLLVCFASLTFYFTNTTASCRPVLRANIGNVKPSRFRAILGQFCVWRVTQAEVESV